MPAYRSDAEGEIRDVVVDHLRQFRPQARIIHEINAVNYMAGRTNRIDVLAISPADIVAVEIKSAKDKLDRLPDQISAMRGVANNVVAAIHEKFLVEKITNEWAAHSERDGKFFRMDVPDGVGLHVPTWVYPKRRRAIDPTGPDPDAIWRLPVATLQTSLPSGAIAMLWGAELAQLCSEFGVADSRRSTLDHKTRALLWHCTGAELTRGICAMLRQRCCVEADPEIETVIWRQDAAPGKALA